MKCGKIALTMELWNQNREAFGLLFLLGGRMNHFQGINESERYNNDLLDEIRRSNLLLEQLVQLLQPKVGNLPVKKVVAVKNKPVSQRGKRS